MKNIFEKEIESFCCGCRACEYVCPVQYILTYQSERDGFIYPKVNKEKNCINCGRCIKACPIKNPKAEKKPIDAFGFINNDEIANSSASGGVFSAVAVDVIQNGGVVYGCLLDENMDAVTERVDNCKDLLKLLSSKYVLCNSNNSYKRVETDLLCDKMVLYCSTPCQVAGLLNYLGRDYPNLLTIDLFCHGVPSPGLFKKYIHFIEDKYKSKVTNVVFRDKKVAWGTAGFIQTERRIPFLGNEDPYYYSFLKARTYQKICYSCPYAKEQRVGDISIGDYWGVENEHPDINRENGVSAVLVNTKKGKEYLLKLNNNLVFKTEIEKISKYNTVLCCPTIYNNDRDLIYEGYQNLETKMLVKRYLKLPYSKVQFLKYKIVTSLEYIGFGKFIRLYFKIKHRRREQ